MKPSYAKKIIHQIQYNYDQISHQFDQTRQFNWPEIKLAISQHLHTSDSILDIGCGNGRLLEDLPTDINYTGIDISPQLIQKATINHPQHHFVTGSMLKLPFPDNKFDKVFAIASLHHIPSDALRLQVIDEIHRVLQPSGILIMTNWNLYQPKYDQFINHNFHLSPELDENDSLIPWKDSQGQTIANRYYHAFTPAEIVTLLQPQFQIITNTITNNNLLTIASKI